MKRLTALQERYLEAASWFHWATRDHYTLWFTGHTGRHKQTEGVLPALVKKGQLRTFRLGKRLVYATNDWISFDGDRHEMFALHPYHGLCCTDCLVRLFLSDRNCEVIPEKVFKKYRPGSVPEWALVYPAKGKLGKRTMLLFEFSTDSQFRGREISAKFARYKRSLPLIEEMFKAKAMVLFVLDVPRWEVAIFVDRVKDSRPDLLEGPYLFTDYETFKAVPFGQALTAPIYMWGEDGQTYPLNKDA